MFTIHISFKLSAFFWKLCTSAPNLAKYTNLGFNKTASFIVGCDVNCTLHIYTSKQKNWQMWENVENEKTHRYAGYIYIYIYIYIYLLCNNKYELRAEFQLQISYRIETARNFTSQ